MSEPELETDEAKLADLARAFDDGDYRAVRDGASLLRSSGDPKTAGAARALLEKVSPDPAARWLFLGALGVILAVAAYWMTRG